MRRLTLSSVVPALAPAVLLTSLAGAQANDECVNAISVGLGPTSYDSTGATDSMPPFTCEPVSGKADIWFEFTAPNNATYIVDLCGSSYDTVLEVLDGGCGALNSVGCNDDTCGLAGIVSFPGTAGTSYLIRAGGWGTAAGSGATGLGFMQIEEFMPSPVELVAHYPLDDTGAVAFDASLNGQDGQYVGAVNGQPGVAGTSARFDGTTSYIDISNGQELDPLRYDFTAMAWINVDAVPNGGQRIFSNDGPGGSWSFSISQFGVSATTHAVLDYGANPAPVVPGTWHHVAIVMSELADVTFYFDGVQSGNVALGQEFARDSSQTWFVGAWDPTFSIPQFFEGRIDDIQVYRGQLSPAEIAGLYANPGSTIGFNPTVGTSYCGAVPNSTGVGGALSAMGSPVVSANTVTLQVENLPVNAFGFFVVSPNQGFVQNPAGSAGNLCLSGQIGRYVGPGQIQQVDQNGMFSLQLDLTAVPTPIGPSNTSPGDTLNFQGWHRDQGSGGGATSNFTNGLEITFQ